MEGQGQQAQQQEEPIALSKKAAKKAERLTKKMAAASMSAVAAGATAEEDPLAAHYGDVLLQDLQSKPISGRQWTKVSQLDATLNGQTVLVRGRCHTTRAKGKIAFLVIRQAGYTVQCVFQVEDKVVSKGLIKFISSLSKESIIDVEGIVDVPSASISGTTQQVSLSHSLCDFTIVTTFSSHQMFQVELKGRKVYCVSKAVPVLPFNLEDAARSEKDFQKAEEVIFFINPFFCILYTSIGSSGHFPSGILAARRSSICKS